MDGDILAFIAAMVFIVLAFGTFAGERSRKHKIQALELKARIEEAKAGQTSAGNEVQSHFEDRLRVLERLATDKGTLLADQIEALRDERRERENG